MACRFLCLLLLLFWTAEPALERDPILYYGLWRSPLVALSFLWEPLPVVRQPLLKVLLLAMVPVCLFWPGAFRRRPWPMDATILVSLGSVGLTLLWGLWRGGSAYQAYYQLGSFVTAMVMALLLLSAIRTPRELRMLGATVLFAALVRGALASYFYLAHVRHKMEPYPPYMTTHDDSLLFTAGIAIALCWALTRHTWTAAFIALSTCGLLLLAIIANNRRLAWVEVLLALVVIYRMLPPGRERRFATVGLVLAAPVLALYVGIGWGRSESIFRPLRALSTTGSVEDNSSLARHEENGNLTHTLNVSGNLLLGTGWGQPYEKLTSEFANFGTDWWQYRYLPHNSLLGIAVFGGFVGIVGIWSIVPMTAFLAASGLQDARGTVERAAGLAVLSLLPAYTAQCFGDIGFQSLTCALIMGALAAAGGKVYSFGLAAREAGLADRLAQQVSPRVAARRQGLRKLASPGSRARTA